MADNEDIELEDFDLDEFDFDEFDMSPESEDDNRSVASSVRDSALTSFRESMTDGGAIRRTMEKALPREYQASFDAYDTVVDMKDQAEDALEPVQKQAKQIAKKNKDLIGKVLPEKMAERLSEWADDGSGGTEAEIDPREAEIGATVGDIFKVAQSGQVDQQAQQAESDQEESERFAIKEENETKRHLSQAELLGGIRSGIDRQTDYQDQILSKYQQKHLELTYRQLYATQDLLEVSKRQSQDQIESFSALIKNTGLPETQKIRYFEEAKREALQKTRDDLTQGVGQFAKNQGAKFFQNTLKSTTNMLTDKLGMLEGSLDAIGGSADMGMSPTQMVGMLLGSSAGEKALNVAVEKALKATGQDADDSTVRRMGQRISLMLTQSPERLKEWVAGDSGRGGLAGMLERFLKDQVPTFQRDDRFELEQISDADEAATFTNRVARSITDVIPGYLAQQLHQLRILASGDPDIEPVVYDPSTGTFGSETTREDTVRDRLFGRSAPNYQRELDETIDQLFRGRDLTDDQRSEVGDLLYDIASKGKRSLDPKDLAKQLRKSDKVDEAHRQSLAATMESNFYNAQGEKYDDITLQKQLEDAIKQTRRFQDTIPRMAESLTQLDRAGYRDELINMGLVGKDRRIDHDVVSSELKGLRPASSTHDATPETPVAHQRRHPADDTGVGDSGVQDTRRHIPETQTPSIKDRLFGKKAPTTVTESEHPDIQALADVLTQASREDQWRLSALMEGQTEQTGKLTQIAQYLSDTPATESGARPDYEQLIREEGRLTREVLERCCVKGDMERNNVLLEEIQRTIPEVALMGEVPAGDRRWRLRGLMDRVGAITGSARDMLTSYYRGTFNVASEGLKTARDMITPWMDQGAKLVGSIGERLVKGKQISHDLYVKGQQRVKVEYNKLINGEYIDEVTGKPIYTLEELRNAKGQILDKAGKIVLNAEEIAKGLETRDGTSVLDKGIGWLKSYYGMLGQGARGALTLVPQAARKVRDLVERTVDLYVQGEPTPRMLATLITKGYYHSKATGKPIYHYRDIDGPVTDDTGENVILTAEELAKVVDKDGNPIKSITDRAWDLANAYGRYVKKTYQTIGRVGKSIWDTSTNWLKDKKDRWTQGRSLFGGGGDDSWGETQSYWDEQLEVLRRIDARLGVAMPLPDGYGEDEVTYTASEPSPYADAAPDYDLPALPTPTPADSTDTGTPDADFAPSSKTTSVPKPGSEILGKAQDLTQGVRESIGGLTEKMSGWFSQRKNKKEKEAESEQKQTSILSKLQQSTQDRAEALTEDREDREAHQAEMTTALTAIQSNTEDEDELRAGGWRSQTAEEEGTGGPTGASEDEEPDLSQASKSTDYGDKSLADMLLGPFAGIMAKFGEYVGVFKSAAMGLAGWLSAKVLGGKGADTAADLLDRKGNRPRTPGKKGFLGKLWSGVKKGGRFLKSAGGMALRAAPAVLSLGASAVSAVGTGLAAVGSVLTAPVVLGAAAVAGLAYGGYKLYQYATRYKPQELDTLRFMQYGVDIHDEEVRKIILPLEAYALDHIRMDGNTLSIDDDGEGTLVQLLGLEDAPSDEDRKVILHWFRRRFLPIFGAHQSVLKNVLDGKTALQDVDDMDVGRKRQYLDAVIKARPESALREGGQLRSDMPLVYDTEHAKAMEAKLLDDFKEGKDAPTTAAPMDKEAMRRQAREKAQAQAQPLEDKAPSDGLTPSQRTTLKSMPKSFIKPMDYEEAENVAQVVYANASPQERATHRDIALTRLNAQRQKAWLEDQGIPVEAAAESGVAPHLTQSLRLAKRQAQNAEKRQAQAQAKVLEYRPGEGMVEKASESPESAPEKKGVRYTPVPPANTVEAPLEPVSTEGRDSQQAREEHEERQRQAQQAAQADRAVQQQRVKKEKRSQSDTVERMASVLGEQLTTQRHMSDNLEKLVLLTEGLYTEETGGSASEYLEQRNFKPTARHPRHPARPVVDLSN